MSQLKQFVNRGNAFCAVVISVVLLIFLVSPTYSNSYPTITKITTSQLHEENDPVHRYQLEVVVDNPTGERIEGFWQVSCGSLEQDKGLKVILSYTGDCSDASVTVTVVNNQLYGQKLTQPVFIPGEKRLVDVKPKVNAPTAMVTVSETPSTPQNSAVFTLNGIVLVTAVVFIVLTAVLLALKKRGLLVLPTSTVYSEEACRCGDTRDCKFIGMKYSVFGRGPHEDEELDLFLDLSADAIDIAKWLISTKGTTPAVKMLPTFLRQMVEIHQKMNKIEKLRDGVDMWGTIQWEECEKQGYWFWAKKSWVFKTKDVKISPPLYPYQLNTQAWNPEYMLNHKFILSKLKEILTYMREKALKECPVKQKEI